MRFIKRKRVARKSRPRKRARKYARRGKSKLVKLIKRVTLSKQETKKSVNIDSTRQVLYNNGFYVLNSAMFFTSQGTSDPSKLASSNRIGDEVTPVGISFRTSVMLDPRQPMCKFKVMLVRGGYGDFPSASNLWVGAMDNKQLDFINTERWTVLKTKYFTIRRPQSGNTNSTTAYTSTVLSDTTSTGVYNTGLTDGAIRTSSWVPYLLKMYFPGKMFGSKIRYSSDGGGEIKNWTYSLIITSHASDEASDRSVVLGVEQYTGTPVAKLDQMCTTFYFKDA